MNSPSRQQSSLPFDPNPDLSLKLLMSCTWVKRSWYIFQLPTEEEVTRFLSLKSDQSTFPNAIIGFRLANHNDRLLVAHIFLLSARFNFTPSLRHSCLSFLFVSRCYHISTWQWSSCAIVPNHIIRTITGAPAIEYELEIFEILPESI